jgi:diguanylate cyclase (GGDEF)-like protein/PAS domain S-box-containing protein
MWNHLHIRLLAIVAVATLPLLLLLIADHQQLHTQAHEAADRRILDLLHAAVVPENIVADNAKQVLRIMAFAQEMEQPDAATCSALAGRLLKTQTNFGNIGAVWPDGRVFCSARPMSAAVSAADRAWFKDAISKNDLSIGQLVVGRITGERSITIGYPLRNADGTLRAVLFGALRLDWLTRLVESAPLSPGWVAAAHGQDGFVIARHPDPENLRGKTMPDHELIRFIQTRPPVSLRELAGADGVRRLYGITPLHLPGGDIYFVIGAPPQLVFAGIEQGFVRSIALTLAVAVLSFLLAWWLVQRDFLRFSQALGRSFRQLSNGDLAARCDASVKVPELRAIVDDFNRMTETLQQLDSAHRKDETDLRLAAIVFDASNEGILIADAAHTILRVNPSFCEITGYTAEEAIGRSTKLLNSGRQDARFYATMWQSLESRGRWRGEIINRRKDGTLYPEWLSISVVRDASGAAQYYMGQFFDLTQQKEMDRRLQQLLNYDTITGLPNRTLFTDRLQQALLLAQRSNAGVAVFWIDLVRFRTVNDTLGHQTGDAVLAEIGRRLGTLVRAGDSAACLSADEFGLVMSAYTQESDIGTYAERLLSAISVPMQIAGVSLVVDANIGISVYPKDGRQVDDLLKAADVALARAKEGGRAAFRFFAPGMDLAAERRLRLETELRGALAAGQLSMHYQPQIDLATGRVCGMEALMRWTHPVLGPISPVEFIPLAEEAGLIGALGAWSLQVACRQNKAWLDSGLPPLQVAVNLSPRQFHQSDVVELIRSTLQETGLPPALLELELTETAFIGDVTEAARIIQGIKALGVQLALDDFGTGYSSLSYLSGFPFDKIKIDQSFVRDVTTNPVNAAIATATIAMARSLDLVVLAEGVETDAQMNFLRTRRCEAMQGHLFSKALPAELLTELLKGGRVLALGGEKGDGAVKQTLLLVDDEPNILSALKRLLRRDGYTILTAESAELGFELLARHAVQVIISDQRMPGMNGTEFLSRAKKLYPNTVRIILSGYTDLESVTDAINRGAIYRFLTKPWEDDKLRADIHDAFRVAQGFAGA